MKKLTIILAAVMLALGAQTASAWKLSDLFGGQSAGETVTSLIIVLPVFRQGVKLQ